jgi:hypothetical protein
VEIAEAARPVAWPSLEVGDGDDVHPVGVLQKHDGVGEAPE